MNRFTYPVKFAMLGGLFLAVIGVLLYNLFLSLNQKIVTAQRELDGLALIGPISQTVQYLQQHRGLSAGQLVGNSQLGPLRAKREQKTTEAMQRVAQALPRSMVQRADWQAIRRDWALVRAHGLTWAIADNFDKHTALVNRLLTFQTTVADTYGLTLDAEYGTYYLIDTAVQKLPQALEHLGQTRAYGVGILTAKQANPDRLRIMHSLTDGFSEWLSFLTDNLKKTAQYNVSINQPLSLASRDINEAGHRILDIVETDIFSRQFRVSGEQFYKIVTEAIDNGYSQLYSVLLPTTEALIKQRIAQARARLYAMIGFALALVLGAIYFSWGVYFSIINSVRTLSQSANRFAAGDLHERVQIESRDEMKDIGESFNKVATAFGRMADELQASNEALEQRVIERTQSLSLMASVFQHSGEAILITDTDINIIDVNTSFTRLTGYTRDEVIGKNPRILSSGNTPLQTYQDMWTALNDTGFWQGEISDKHKDGRIYPKWLSITVVRDNDGHVINYIANFSDMTERKAAEAEIQYLAHHDTLTQLPNRFTLTERLSQAMTSASRNREKIAVMFIDLDRFKTINDTLGHDIGDRLLILVAQRLTACARSSDIVARLGGDEFVLAMTEVKNTEVIFRLVEKVIYSLGEVYVIGGKHLNSSPSIGIAIYPDNGETVETVMKNADIAMYHAKQMGRNTYQFFDPSMNAASLDRLELENDMRAGLERGEFCLHYQPQLCLRTGRIFGVEALVRWQHPSRGYISPETFISIAEESGWMQTLGDWIVRAACQQLKAFADAGLPDLHMAINLSARQFNQSQIAQTIEQTISHAAVDPSLIEFEITETMAMTRPDEAAKSMRRIRDIGVRLSIDDFGTGYSSLQYLKTLPVSCLKIDRSFVRDIETDPNDAAICSATISLAHSLGLCVVAEGVETQAQLDYLHQLGCDKTQGYHISRPLPADRAVAFVLARNGK